MQTPDDSIGIRLKRHRSDRSLSPVTQPVLHTERLHLKPLTLEDIDAFHTIWGDPAVIWWGHRPSLDETRAFAHDLLGRSPFAPAGTGWWLLIDRSTGEVVGDGVLQPVPRPTREIEVGWHLARAHWGVGFATEAAKRLLHHGFVSLDLPTIVADIALQNSRSIAVADRIGMTRRPDTIDRAGMPHGVWEASRSGLV